MIFSARSALGALLVGAGLTGFAPPMAAADPAPSFSDLLRQTRQAPRLKAAEAGVAQAQGLAQQAAARPNPTLSLEVENFAGDGPFRGVRSAETTGTVEQTIELGGKRDARIDSGRAGVMLSRARAVLAETDFAFELAEGYGAAETADLRLQLANDALALAEDDARLTTALVTAGKEADLRALQTQAAVEAARADVGEAQAERSAALAQLTALADSAVPFTSIPVSLLAHADQAEVIASIDPLTTPSYRVAVAERDEIAGRVRIEQTRSTPDMTVSLGLRRLAGDKATALVGGISVPFPVFDRNGGNVAAVNAELSAAEARLRAARQAAEAGIRSAAARLQASFIRVRAAHDGERAAQEVYRLTRVGYEAGKLPLSEVLAARRSLSDARNQALTARQDRLNAEAELAHLAGLTPFGDRS